MGILETKCILAFFCEKLLPNIARHLTLVHPDEAEVAKILNVRKGSKERRELWGILVNKGDFHHNYDVLEKSTGCLIPKYRQKQEAPISQGVHTLFSL